MSGPAAPAGIGRVQHVVMQQRSHVDHFRGGGQIVKIGPFATEQAGRREGQQGAEAFGPRPANIACHFPHRGGQTVHGLFQSRLNAGLFLSEKTREGRQQHEHLPEKMEEKGSSFCARIFGSKQVICRHVPVFR